MRDRVGKNWVVTLNRDFTRVLRVGLFLALLHHKRPQRDSVGLHDVLDQVQEMLAQLLKVYFFGQRSRKGLNGC